jgi:anti-sigma factor RsiW
MSPNPISENDLHAYVDALLPPLRRAEVEAWLAEHPDEMAHVSAWRDQNAALRELFRPVLDEDLPDRLRRLAEAAPQPVEREKKSILSRWALQRIAAGLLVATLGALGGWFGHGQYASSERLVRLVPLAHQAAVAHVVYSPDLRRPVEVGAEQEEQLVKWLSKRLSTPVKPPKLGDLGYELVGGRLLPGNSGPVAQFMYQDALGRRMTLYLTPENTEPHAAGFRFAREGEINVFYWVDGSFGYALSAAIDKGELARVATAVYAQLAR